MATNYTFKTKNAYLHSFQPFLASLGTNPLSKSGTSPPPPGSEAERTMLSSELYKVVKAVGGRELKIDWPKVSWALPKQPLFVAPLTEEFGDTGGPHISVSSYLLKLISVIYIISKIEHLCFHYLQVREAILERLENNQFLTFGYIKQKIIESGLKMPDNNLRTNIKVFYL